MYKNKSYLSIKDWAEKDRPREKLLEKGKQNLTDAELLAIILGSGTKNETALDVAKQILREFDNDLDQLGRCTVAELLDFRGIGEARAVSVVAALELSRRRQQINIREKPVIRTSEDAFRVMAPLLMDLSQEEFWVVLLSSGNRVTGRKRISLGGVNKTLADARVIFRYALSEKASSIILYHNHPSGSLKPSRADINLTEKLYQAGGLVDILVLDHLIISNEGYYSFADEGMIFKGKQ